MGCVASRLGEEEEVVSICRERKRVMKLAVERRYALADAHCRYCHSLHGVSGAIKLFVARHSTPSSPFLITFPPPESSDTQHNPPLLPPPSETVMSNPMFLQQNPCQPTTTTQETAFPCCDSRVSSCSSEERASVESREEKHESCGGYFYMGLGGMQMQMQMQMQMPSPQRDFGWDFFNPFAGVRPDVTSVGFQRNPEDDLRAVREEEGIPDLEDEGGGGGGGGDGKDQKEVHVVAQESVDGNMVGSGGAGAGGGGVKSIDGIGGDMCSSHQGEKGLTVIDTPAGGRELLDALKDIEDHFIRAYDSGKHISKMLEANKMNLQSGLEEIKENSTKIIQAITWHRSNTSRSSSCKSLVPSSSKNSTTWTEYKNDLFDDYGGMASGSHSLTLGRLYAWEKKLYEEVKAGDSIRKLYERKCVHLRNKDIRGENILSVDKTRAAVKDLYSRILVAIRRAESISEKIQKLTEEELQPQITELLQGLTQSWKIMMESHETQNHIIFEVKTFDCPTYGKFCNDSHRLATLQLEAEIQNWRECFTEYVAAQRSYVEALNGWLSKFIVPEVEFGSRARKWSPPVPYGGNKHPLYVICRDWLTFMENLPDKAVSVAMKSFARDVRALWVQQGEEQEQKRKVDKMAKELEKKTISYQKVEGRIVQETKLLEYKPSEVDSQSPYDTQLQTDHLLEKKDAIDNLRRKLEVEKEKHHNCMQETQRITLNGFQTGFSLIFDALVQFSKASLKMYNDAVNSSQNFQKSTCIQEVPRYVAEDDPKRN